MDNWSLVLNILHKTKDLINFSVKGPCSLCAAGGDCITGRKTIGAKLDRDGETVESVLRKENPYIFKLLQYSLQNLFKDKVLFKILSFLNTARTSVIIFRMQQVHLRSQTLFLNTCKKVFLKTK